MGQLLGSVAVRALEEDRMTTKDLSFSQVIQLAVATEQLGARHYSELAQKFADKQDVADTFRQLAKDEEAHQATFRKLLDQVEGAKVLTPDDDGYYLMRAAASGEFFDKKKADDLSHIQTAEDALTHAVELERSTLLYYHTMRSVLGASPELDAIIAEERSHMTALMRVMIAQARFRGISDPW
jgi:rubrerythrin